MRDEMDLLRDDSQLLQLLQHYVHNTSDDRERWLDRCMALDDVEARRLSELHGWLIAFGWIEQNVGQATTVQPATCPECYRTTTSGRRALKQFRSAENDADNLAAAA